jgi:hypothetical protein
MAIVQPCEVDCDHVKTSTVIKGIPLEDKLLTPLTEFAGEDNSCHMWRPSSPLLGALDLKKVQQATRMAKGRFRL